MLYLLFILLLLAVIFAVVWLATRGEKAATEEPDTYPDPEDS